MKWVLPTSFLQQLPLLALFIIPLIQAAFGWRKICMKSAVHFQQGTMSSSPWRIAVLMCTLTLPQFSLWCLLMRGPSAIFFLLGSCFAIPVSIVSVAPILHYIPSPSVVAYIQHRFSSGRLRLWISIIQALIGGLIAFLLLFQTTNLLVSVTSYPFHLVISLIAAVSFISVVISGHSSVMTPSLIFNLIVIFSGLGIFLYFGIEHVTSFTNLVPKYYSLADSIVSTCVGFILSLYHLTSSPIFYQAFFPLCTIHKLRLSLIFFAVFQLFGCILVYLTTSLFSSFMEKHCTLPYSFSSMFQFIKVTVPHRTESYMIIAGLATVLISFLQWQLLTLTTHIWEEFLKIQLRDVSPRKQLRILQAFSFWEKSNPVVQITIFLISLVLSLLGVAVHFLQLPIHTIIPTTVLIIFVICAIITGVFLCGYYFPCCNSKGALSSFLFTILIFSGLIYLNIARNDIPRLTNSCFNEIKSNATHRAHHIDKFLSFLNAVPLQAHPILALLISVVVCLLVSAITGGQDQMSLDWNLVVFPCTPLMKGRASYAKRPVVESESFRFAQQFNITPPDSSR